MAKKWLKYSSIMVLAALALYNAVYFKKLSEVQSGAAGAFNPETFAGELWKQKFPAKINEAVLLSDFFKALDANADNAFEKYAHALAVGNYRYVLVKTEATVSAIHEDDVILQVIHADSLLELTLATEFIYGNAIRDASGLVEMKNFSDMAHLYKISEALNKTVRSTVVPPFRKQVKQGDKVEVIAALEMNKEHIGLQGLELMPVQIKMLP